MSTYAMRQTTAARMGDAPRGGEDHPRFRRSGEACLRGSGLLQPVQGCDRAPGARSLSHLQRLLPDGAASERVFLRLENLFLIGL